MPSTTPTPSSFLPFILLQQPLQYQQLTSQQLPQQQPSVSPQLLPQNGQQPATLDPYHDPRTILAHLCQDPHILAIQKLKFGFGPGDFTCEDEGGSMRQRIDQEPASVNYDDADEYFSEAAECRSVSPSLGMAMDLDMAPGLAGGSHRAPTRTALAIGAELHGDRRDGEDEDKDERSDRPLVEVETEETQSDKRVRVDHCSIRGRSPFLPLPPSHVGLNGAQSAQETTKAGWARTGEETGAGVELATAQARPHKQLKQQRQLKLKLPRRERAKSGVPASSPGLGNILSEQCERAEKAEGSLGQTKERRTLADVNDYGHDHPMASSDDMSHLTTRRGCTTRAARERGFSPMECDGDMTLVVSGSITQQAQGDNGLDNTPPLLPTNRASANGEPIPASPCGRNIRGMDVDSGASECHDDNILVEVVVPESGPNLARALAAVVHQEEEEEGQRPRQLARDKNAQLPNPAGEALISSTTAQAVQAASIVTVTVATRASDNFNNSSQGQSSSEGDPNGQRT
ncbi:hypothetical protein BGW38_002378, partial [Lunasporangiospora selenospora]